MRWLDRAAFLLGRWVRRRIDAYRLRKWKCEMSTVQKCKAREFYLVRWNAASDGKPQDIYGALVARSWSTMHSCFIWWCFYCESDEDFQAEECQHVGLAQDYYRAAHSPTGEQELD